MLFRTSVLSVNTVKLSDTYDSFSQSTLLKTTSNLGCKNHSRVDWLSIQLIKELFFHQLLLTVSLFKKFIARVRCFK